MNAMQPPQSVEEVKATLETTEKGGVRQSIRNCLTVFQRDPVLAGAIAYNILTDRKDIIKPIGFHRESTALTDTDMKYLLLYLEETYGLTSEKKIETAIGIVANENKYHPIRDFLNSLAWDGTERIRFCLRHFLGADVDDYTYEALKLFMLGAITRAFKPGSKFEIMLCLVGGQGAGKSTFFRLLAVRDEWFSDDLRKLDDDNVYRKLQGHWIIEMSEMMATANAKSIEEIKSFLSRQKEVYKIPYETHPADRPRQCVFGGTSNANSTRAAALAERTGKEHRSAAADRPCCKGSCIHSGQEHLFLPAERLCTGHRQPAGRSGGTFLRRAWPADSILRHRQSAHSHPGSMLHPHFIPGDPHHRRAVPHLDEKQKRITRILPAH